jgi:uncharacterized membrane protein HdeD (DUF308 family)
MTHTILLSKVLGLFALIVGAAMVIRRNEFGEVIATYARDRTWRVLYSAIELLAGLFLVVVHNEWGTPAAVVVSLFGWLAILEGASYLFLPDRVVEPFIRSFSRPSTLAVSGIAAMIAGLYLAAHGFGVA